MLFTLSNAAMLPLASSALTARAGSAANLFIAACIVLPQAVVAVLSPSIGRLAQLRGRRPVLLLGFAMLPLRGLALAMVGNPLLVVLVQLLDGISAATFGIMVPLVISDIAGRSGHFNLCLGAVGFAIGLGATLSTTLAGWTADEFGDPAAFAVLAAIGLVSTFLVLITMPETRPYDPVPPYGSARH
jgi:MFS family permease